MWRNANLPSLCLVPRLTIFWCSLERCCTMCMESPLRISLSWLWVVNVLFVFCSSWVSYTHCTLVFLVTCDPWLSGLHLGRGWVFSHRNIWNHRVEMNPEPVLSAPHPPCNTEQYAQLGLLTLLGSAHAILCHFTHCSYCLPMFPSAATIMPSLALLSQPHGFFSFRLQL